MKHLNYTAVTKLKGLMTLGLGAVVVLAAAISVGLASPARALGDTEAPFASISSPVSGTNLAKGTTVTIVVDAFDNVGVTQVDFYVNNHLVCSGSAGTCDWLVPDKRGVKTYNLEVRVYDAAGNVGTGSAVVTAS